MTRRTAMQTAAGATFTASAALGKTAGQAGRLKQSVARWCYSKITLEDLAKAGADMGLSAIDLLSKPEDWPTARKYGLVPTVTPGAGTIPDGWNRKESHDRLEKEMLTNLALAAAAKVPNVITFSGNRKGMADDVGKENIFNVARIAALNAEPPVAVADDAVGKNNVAHGVGIDLIDFQRGAAGFEHASRHRHFFGRAILGEVGRIFDDDAVIGAVEQAIGDPDVAAMVEINPVVVGDVPTVLNADGFNADIVAAH